MRMECCNHSYIRVNTMNKTELINTIKSIYDWPIDEKKTWEVYNNFIELLLAGDQGTKDYLDSIIKFNKEQRQEYRNHIAELGYELRPDELSQYILLIIIAFNEVKELQNG